VFFWHICNFGEVEVLSIYVNVGKKAANYSTI
jgi:hypothetical protein